MKMQLRLRGLGVSFANMPFSEEKVFVVVAYPLAVYEGHTYGGVLGTAKLVSDWFHIPDDLLADYGSLGGKRGVIEVSGAVLVSANADFEFRLQKPESDDSFTDVAKSLKKNVSWTGYKLGTLKVDFGLRVATSVEGQYLLHNYLTDAIFKDPMW